MTTRYYQVKRADGSRVEDAAMTHEVAALMLRLARNEGGGRLLLVRCSKTGKPQRGARPWYMEITAGRRSPDSVRPDCY